ncbi:MAG: DNA mismatch repair endonuclease MutL [Candidatus Dormibacteraeota bacterium]|nr:DNA mismatch repair endonuclease MutL [Candidatus Dormibacteraeota bacterium]MBO0760673.1 DNA mismatch repair endonuclease MutL [Candidatus Dormibacteraeota bacterium]
MAIRVLPGHVADAIAAGEVVERPASVLKELVENALDAGARRLTIEVRGAGRTLVRIADDGVGIPPEELELAFRRHATSKVADLPDLQGIATLGFRGEALASVAAVADVECRSQGARIRLRGGEVLERGAAMPTPGTVLEVRDLFAQTPGRLKFLKTETTETAACVKAAQTYALLYPEVRFDVSVDGRSVVRSPGSGDPRAAVSAVLGPAVAREMLELSSDEVRGMVSEPRLSRGSRDAMLLAVNRRPITSRALGYALEECYLGMLEKGRYPVTVVDLVVEPGLLDVNVHPAKREVRFTSERTLFGAVQRAVRAALTGSRPYEVRPALASSEAAPAAARDLRHPFVHEARTALPPDPAPAAPGGDGVLRPMGQVQDSYLLAESEDGVVLIDQHAAHERVLYNRFLRQLSGDPAAAQPLLLPETVEADPAEVAAALEHGETLAALGFQVEGFGPGMLRVLAGPAATPPERLREAVLELCSLLAEGRPNDLRERLAASLSCHSAVRFGDALDGAEQRRLLEELEVAEQSVTCPHGRPTRLVLSWQELQRHFRRTY